MCTWLCVIIYIRPPPPQIPGTKPGRARPESPRARGWDSHCNEGLARRRGGWNHVEREGVIQTLRPGGEATSPARLPAGKRARLRRSVRRAGSPKAADPPARREVGPREGTGLRGQKARPAPRPAGEPGASASPRRVGGGVAGAAGGRGVAAAGAWPEGAPPSPRGCRDVYTPDSGVRGSSGSRERMGRR